jgi:hypothetical protein
MLRLESNFIIFRTYFTSRIENVDILNKELGNAADVKIIAIYDDSDDDQKENVRISDHKQYDIFSALVEKSEFRNKLSGCIVFGLVDEEEYNAGGQMTMCHVCSILDVLKRKEYRFCGCLDICSLSLIETYSETYNDTENNKIFLLDFDTESG